MSPKKGRPTNDPKTNQQRIRMSDREIKMLDYCCEFYGLSKADIIRQGIEHLYNKAQNKKE